MTAIETYQKFFPEFTPSPFQQDIIEQTVTDLDVWRETLKYWAGNAYRPQSIAKMLEYYSNYRKSISLDDVIREFADKDARLVEIAYLQTLIPRESTEPIKSINYFRPAIEEIYAGLEKVRVREMSVSSEMVDVVLQRRREQFTNVRTNGN